MRHVISILFFPNEQRGGCGGGGYAAILFFFFFFSSSDDHERDWPPCKVVFLGLTTNTLNVPLCEMLLTLTLTKGLDTFRFFF